LAANYHQSPTLISYSGKRFVGKVPVSWVHSWLVRFFPCFKRLLAV
jgi:hypothetical protein